MRKKIVSLFSGIGGLEYGFSSAKFSVELLCENDPAAQSVLKRHHPGVKVEADVTTLKSIPSCDILLAGFPCQDLSQAGRKVGITGERSGLVEHLFRLIKKAKPAPSWVILENVPYMLSLDRGNAMNLLTSTFESLGYSWAYRVVDARAFGVPQRRHRVIFVASKKEDPRTVLFKESYDVGNIDGKPTEFNPRNSYGFYWTEGKLGIGWTKEGIPPIKGGSSVGIPSPPAIWIPSKDFVGTISLNDAERAQGFPENWTEPASDSEFKKNSRWRLVGNAVCADVSTWLASQILKPGEGIHALDKPLGVKWPKSAWGSKGKRFEACVSTWCAVPNELNLIKYLKHPLKPLSARATNGFVSRALLSTNIVYPKEFIASLKHHAKHYEQ